MYLLGMSHCAHCLCAWQVRVRVGVMVRVRDRLMLKLTRMVRAHLESLGVLKLFPCCVPRSFDFLRLLCLESGLNSDKSDGTSSESPRDGVLGVYRSAAM